MIRRSTVQKNCQEGVNTRENASTCYAGYVHHEARAHQQSIVALSSFRRCSFSLPQVSQTCSQLIHTPFMAALASGLEIRNRSRKRQEKNELNFQLRQKNFLDGKKKRACPLENRNSVSKKISREPNRDQFGSLRRPDRGADPCASRVDQIGLRTQFPVSVSGRQSLSNCRCRQPIAIPTRMFQLPLTVRIGR